MKRLCLLLPLLFLLSSCTSTRLKIPNPNDPDMPQPSSPFEHVAYWGSGIAGLAVLIGIILLWSKPRLGQQVIVTAFSVLIGAQIMIWVGTYLVFISAITLTLGLAYISYKNKDEIVDIFDGETDVIYKEEGHG